MRLSLALLITAQGVNSFVPQTTTSIRINTSSSSSSSSALDAKIKKKKKATTTSTAGFGTVVQKKAPKKKEENDDYAAFPALEDTVKNTLIPSNVEDQENAKDLPNEIYDRLGQIYGFPDFNFPAGWFDDEAKDGEEATEDGEATSTSLNDLLTAGNSDTPKSSLGSDFGDLLKPKSSGDDFADLISAATNGPVDAISTEAPQGSSGNFDIENLPPFTKFRILNVDPMVLAIDDFFTDEECDEYVDLCANPKKRTSSNDMPMMSRSKTVGKDSRSKAQRTSTTWFHHFKGVPAVMAKASRLLGLRNIDRWEEPQTVRYQQTEKFTWHLDALSPADSSKELGGQRVATLLVYLTDVGEGNGGSTVFRDLGPTEGEYLRVQPKKGSALLFFPAAGGVPNTPFDIRTLHAGEALAADAPSDKWIAQMWLRENDMYKATAPPGNSHSLAREAINDYCNT